MTDYSTRMVRPHRDPRNSELLARRPVQFAGLSQQLQQQLAAATEQQQLAAPLPAAAQIAAQRNAAQLAAAGGQQLLAAHVAGELAAVEVAGEQLVEVPGAYDPPARPASTASTPASTPASVALPTVGRTVHWFEPDRPTRPLAAVVTAVEDDGVVLLVLQPYGTPYEVGPVGADRPTDRGVWRWPPRA